MENHLRSLYLEKQEELQAFKEMALNKLLFGELDFETLNRILNHVYELGHYVGHIHGEQYSKELYEGETK
jgi:hypothetical protein